VPLTVQTDVVELENDTVNPDVAVALIVNVPPGLYVRALGVAKEIV
jgi:hypothetical protein